MSPTDVSFLFLYYAALRGEDEIVRRNDCSVRIRLHVAILAFLEVRKRRPLIHFMRAYMATSIAMSK